MVWFPSVGQPNWQSPPKRATAGQRHRHGGSRVDRKVPPQSAWRLIRRAIHNKNKCQARLCPGEGGALHAVAAGSGDPQPWLNRKMVSVWTPSRRAYGTGFGSRIVRNSVSWTRTVSVITPKIDGWPALAASLLISRLTPRPDQITWPLLEIAPRPFQHDLGGHRGAGSSSGSAAVGSQVTRKPHGRPSESPGPTHPRRPQWNASRRTCASCQDRVANTVVFTSAREGVRCAC